MFLVLQNQERWLWVYGNDGNDARDYTFGILTIVVIYVNDQKVGEKGPKKLAKASNPLFWAMLGRNFFSGEVFPYIAIFEIQLILPDNRMGDARAKADSASISSKAWERKRSRQLPPWGSFWSHVFLSAILITFFWEKIFSVHGWAGATNPGWPWHHWKDWPDRIRGIRVRFWSKLIIAPPLLTIILV